MIVFYFILFIIVDIEAYHIYSNVLKFQIKSYSSIRTNIWLCHHINKPFIHRTFRLYNSNDDHISENNIDRNSISNINQFIEIVHKNVISENIQSLKLSNIINSKFINNNEIKSNLIDLKDIKSISGKYVIIKSKLKFQLNYRYHTNDQVKNYDLNDLSQHIEFIIRNNLFKSIIVNTKADHKQFQLIMKRIPNNSTNDNNGCYHYSYKEVILKHSRTIENNDSNKNSNDNNTDIANNADIDIDDNNNKYNHDRQKNLFISINEPFLEALQITTKIKLSNKYSNNNDNINKDKVIYEYRPKVDMRDKFKQIQKFVEIVDNLVNESIHDNNDDNSKSSLKIVDMGCGLAYLTFAMHSHFIKNYQNIQTIGIDMRPALIENINGIARKLGKQFDGLAFEHGSIIDYTINNKQSNSRNILKKVSISLDNKNDNNIKTIDIMKNMIYNNTILTKDKSNIENMDVLVALHACDTATDDSIWCGIQNNARIIVVSPCCHKQVRRQVDTHFNNINNDNINPLNDIFQYGIYRERQSEMITDTIRSLLLQYLGYKTKVFEFISSEHTSKNIIITAIKNNPQISYTNYLSNEHNNSNIEIDNIFINQISIKQRIKVLMNTYGINNLRLLELLNINIE